MLLNESSLFFCLFVCFISEELEDAKSQAQVLGLDKEVKKLKGCDASDKIATAELCAKDQLKSLHGTVMKINQERAEVSPHSKCPPRLPLPRHRPLHFELSLETLRLLRKLSVSLQT